MPTHTNSNGKPQQNVMKETSSPTSTSSNGQFTFKVPIDTPLNGMESEKEYMKQFFVPLTNGNHAAIINGKYI